MKTTKTVEYSFDKYICGITELTCCGCSLYCGHRKEKMLIDKIKKIRNQYGFPIWLIKEALEYYDEDEDKAIKKLKEIYCAAGDHPDIYIKRSIEKFIKKVKHRKAEYKLDEIRRYLDNNLHPLVSPDNWSVYSDLTDLVDELGELIEKDE